MLLTGFDLLSKPRVAWEARSSSGTGAAKPVVLAVPCYIKCGALAPAQCVVLDNCETALNHTRVCFYPNVDDPDQAFFGGPESCTNTTTATWLILPVVICLS